MGKELKAILLIDNCPAHPFTIESTNDQIKIKFLPKNTTSILQPQDQGIIASKVKKRFKSELFKKYLQFYAMNPHE